MRVSSTIVGAVLPLFAIAAALFLGSVYGVLAGQYRWFPRDLVADAVTGWEQRDEEPHHLFPVRHSRAGARHYGAERDPRDVVLVTSYFAEIDWRAGVRLIDRAGQILHTWDADPLRLFPAVPHSDGIAGRKHRADNYVHGTYLYPDGSLLLNIEYLGLARLDACGEVMWTLARRTHHSIHPAEDGSFWVAAMVWRDDTRDGRTVAQDYPGLQAPVAEDWALRVSQHGRVLQEVNVLRALFGSPARRVFWKHRARRFGDVTHLNKVDALPQGLASAFARFRAGDLVVSLRNIDTVAVIDPRTEAVRWYAHQPWHRQHDPHFMPDGRIAVFDNNSDGTHTGSYLGGSRIVVVDPGDDASQVVYAGDQATPFYTAAGGKMQPLPDGGWLITEARAGRVFEVGADGTLRWEWIHEPYDARRVPEVLEGRLVEVTAADVAAWGCAAEQS